MADPLRFINWGGDSILGSALGGLFGGFGGAAGMGAIRGAQNDLKNLPGMAGSQNLMTSFGSALGQNSKLNPEFAANQSALAAMGPGLLGGGLFNDPGLQAALGQNNIAGALGQANQAFGQQVNPMALGSLGGAFGQAGQLGGMLSNMAMQGPQDFSGGLQNNLFGQGFANQMAAGNQSALQAQQLASMRAAAQPQNNRMFNQLQDRLFAQGRLGSTGGSENMRALFEAQNQQDMGFQTEAFNRALQQQNFLGNLGSQQLQQGAGLMGQNLGQFNQNIAGAQGLFGLQNALEGQAFNQNLQSTVQNQSAGLQRLQAAQGLLGFGGDLFSQQFGLGLGANEGLLGFGNLGLQLARSPFELQAALLQGSGEHAGALANLGKSSASASGGMFGGLASAAMSLFSDVRLKDNIHTLGTAGGVNWYTWDWNEKAHEVGAGSQPSFGVIAQEVEEYMPEAVFTLCENGYKKVNYSMILGVL